MELKIYKDSASVCEKICDTKAELSIEAEALIPDYMPQVFKIVKCLIIPVVLQKRAGAARLTVEGYLRALMYYQESAEGELCCLEQKQSFTKTFELESTDFESADIYTSGETQYVNCRAVTERRVDIRGAYMLSVRAYAAVKKQVVTSLAQCGIQQKSTALKGLQIGQPYEKPVTLEDEITFAKSPAAIVSTNCTITVQDCRLTAGKAVCKGEAEVTVLYRTKGESVLLKETKKLPFNEVAEVNAQGDKAHAFALGYAVSAAAAQGEGDAYKLSASLLLDIYSVHPTEVMAVTDAFSTEYETDLTSAKVLCETAEQSLRYKQEVTLTGKMPDEDAEILGVTAELVPPEAAVVGEDIRLRGKITAHVFCKNALGEIDCYDKSADYVLPPQFKTLPEALCVRANAYIKELSARKIAGEMSVAALLETDGILTQLSEVSVLTNAEVTAAREKADDASLRIYYASPGESLFDIGKRYFASPAQIAAANGIEAEALSEAARLLIPLSV